MLLHSLASTIHFEIFYQNWISNPFIFITISVWKAIKWMIMRLFLNNVVMCISWYYYRLCWGTARSKSIVAGAIQWHHIRVMPPPPPPPPTHQQPIRYNVLQEIAENWHSVDWWVIIIWHALGISHHPFFLHRCSLSIIFFRVYSYSTTNNKRISRHFIVNINLF